MTGRKSKRSNPPVRHWTGWGFGSWVNLGTWASVHISWLKPWQRQKSLRNSFGFYCPLSRGVKAWREIGFAHVRSLMLWCWNASLAWWRACSSRSPRSHCSAAPRAADWMQWAACSAHAQAGSRAKGARLCARSSPRRRAASGSCAAYRTGLDFHKDLRSLCI